MGEEETAIQAFDVWSRDRLTGKSVSFKGIPAETEENGTGDAPLSPRQRRKSKVKMDLKLDPMLWGQPGHLTEEEADIYVSGHVVTTRLSDVIRLSFGVIEEVFRLICHSGCGAFSLDERLGSWLPASRTFGAVFLLWS
jgi:hypothetical protein